MKKWLKAAVLAIVVVFALGVIKNFALKMAVEQGVRSVTGLPMSIRKFDLGLLTTKIDIREMKVFNPKDFPEKTMLSMPSIYVDYNLTSFFKGKVHITDAVLDLKEFFLIKNKEGRFNIDALKSSGAAPQEKEGPKEEKPSQAPEIQIDSLELKIGRVIYKDYTAGDEPRVQEFNVNLDERYENITNPQALVGLIVFKALAKTSLKNLVNLDTYKNLAKGALATAQKVVTKTAETAKKAAEKTAETAKKAADKTAETAKEAAKKTGETLEKATESLKGLFPTAE